MLHRLVTAFLFIPVVPQAVRSQPAGPNIPQTSAVPDPSLANNFGDGIIGDLKTVLETYSGTIGATASSLLLLLLTFDLVINVGRSVISNSGDPLSDVLTRFVFRLLFVLFALFVINNISDVVKMVADAAVRLASQASESPETFVEPSVSGILLDGIGWAWKILKEISIWKPLSVFYILAAVLMLVLTAILAAMVVVAYAELYIGTLGGLIVLAFAGFEGAKDAATRFISSVIGKGLSLLTLLIVYSVVAQLILDVAGADSAALGVDNVMIILILQIVAAILILRLPASVEGLAGGVGSSGAGTLAGMAAAGLAMKAAAVATGGAGAAAAGVAGGVAQGAKAAVGGEGITGTMKAAGKGAAKTAGRYGGAYFSRGRSMTGEAVSDVGEYAGKILNRLRK